MSSSPFLSQNELPRAILFDHDGVLVTSESLHTAAWGHLFAEIGLPYHPEEFQRHVGRTAPQTLAVLLDQYRPGWSRSEWDLDALALRKNDFYLKLAETGLRVYPGVVEILEWCRARGVKTAVVSNAKRRELRTTLEKLGLAPYFTEIISRDDAGIAKPDPTPYLMGAASVGFEPAQCLAVEDSPPGLEAALLARVPAIGVASNFRAQDLRAPVPGRPDLKALAVAESMTELYGWLSLSESR